MDKRIEKFMTKRNIVLIMLVFLCVITSFILYGKNKSKVFKDEYMKNIFVEEEATDDNSVEVNAEPIKEVKGENQLTKGTKMIVVEIKGEVVNPDVYEISEGSIIRDLITKAGGLTNEANIGKINRADKLRDNQLIVIPNKNELSNANTNINVSKEGNTAEEGIININTASLEELQKINGVGEVKAKSIINYREKNGGFKSIDEMKNIEGIGDKTFEKMKDQITV
ncbi:helix-hairpin-helix domain-containing protein [Clostridium tertium]|jgi:competence protein ComEA|uniref:helix-hairpin-helix domain-containing protein n=1 Tax=Clostridium TaxID=1485 RepID=UPI0018A9CF3D|nr:MULTISPECIES: helix-hairpin-helix domain-containing protein [Clostridium]MBS5307338.1 helix-hairpin-helix domain-containing protein [Clostridium sp.]MBS5884748.1 helix-hairpin-helix domain-containing protein [Clostridium sp.]MDB1921497.1 helix-hairpin-helix domain-containing protein [Clostridium tertium]MDB1924741.1 helix-hairpin-helix domain-containing protein [Clostridium tertium]MDB1928269.1 helix-hairpin-helix domain-containing protein [Clostridium tertium]